MTSMDQNESAIDVCETCGGDGKVEFGHPNASHPDRVAKCEHCNGEGFVLVAAEEAGEERIQIAGESNGNR